MASAPVSVPSSIVTLRSIDEAAIAVGQNAGAQVNAALQGVTASGNASVGDLVNLQYEEANYATGTQTASAVLSDTVQTMKTIANRLGQV